MIQLKHAKIQNKTRPGLVALYDIRPGNRAGLFLQPRSPHRTATSVVLWQNHCGWPNVNCRTLLIYIY